MADTQPAALSDTTPQAMTAEELRKGFDWIRGCMLPSGRDAVDALEAHIAAKDAEIKQLLADSGSVWKEKYREWAAADTDERDGLNADVERLRGALQPFAEPHFMGDVYVKFAPRLLVAARAALTAHRAGKEKDNGCLIETVFRRAQAASLAAYKHACAEGVRRDERDIIEARALITAYLSDPEVEDAIADLFPSPTGGQQVLQAIGAKP